MLFHWYGAKREALLQGRQGVREARVRSTSDGAPCIMRRCDQQQRGREHMTAMKYLQTELGVKASDLKDMTAEQRESLKEDARAEMRHKGLEVSDAPAK